MSYYDDYVRTNKHEPSYEELREQVKLLEDEQRRQQEEQREQEEWVRRQEKQWWPGDPKEIAEPEPVIQTCNHIHENGTYCRSVAMRGREYCRFHLRERGRRLKMARARARGQRWRLDLPPLEDLYAVQVGIMQVLQALAHDQLDKGRGGLMLYGLQQAATNLRCPQEVWDKSSRFEAADDEGPSEYDNFEAEYDLPKGIDVDTPPEVAFPKATPAAISEEKANLMEVTALDVELMEIWQHEGAEGVERKLKQVAEAEQRRYRRAQAQLAHARHVVRAAAQNAAREARFVERSQADLAAAEAREKAAAESGAGCPILSPAVGERVGEAGAPPLSASVADRVGEPTRKEPQSAATATEVAAKASKLG
jgi:hypothetical protein